MDDIKKRHDRAHEEASFSRGARRTREVGYCATRAGQNARVVLAGERMRVACDRYLGSRPFGSRGIGCSGSLTQAFWVTLLRRMILMDMNVELEFPGVVGSVAQLLGAARRSLSLDPRAAALYICEAEALLKVETLVPDVVAQKISASLARWQLVRALELFEMNFDRPIRLGEVADAVRLSKSHFSRAFSGSVGEPPASYLRRYRVRRAREMMLSTCKSLRDIALDCGFADQAHFTRVFSRMVGVTPAVWRRAFSKGPGLTSLPRV
jgi:AraC-like DNA-binding protein